MLRWTLRQNEWLSDQKIQKDDVLVKYLRIFAGSIPSLEQHRNWAIVMILHINTSTIVQ